MRTVVVIGLTLAAWAVPAGALGQSTETVTVTDTDFEPAELRVGVGDTVTWVPVGTEPHTVSAEDRTFESDPTGTCRSSRRQACLVARSDGTVGTKASFTHTFREEGSYRYSCAIHGFEGKLVVASSDDDETAPDDQSSAPAVAGGLAALAVVVIAIAALIRKRR